MRIDPSLPTQLENEYINPGVGPNIWLAYCREDSNSHSHVDCPVSKQPALRCARWHCQQKSRKLDMSSMISAVPLLAAARQGAEANFRQVTDLHMWSACLCFQIRVFQMWSSKAGRRPGRRPGGGVGGVRPGD